MAVLVIRVDVDVDPTRVDPLEVAESLMYLYDEARKVDPPDFEMAQESLEAEWQ
jgi:hypothetical protein